MATVRTMNETSRRQFSANVFAKYSTDGSQQDIMHTARNTDDKQQNNNTQLSIANGTKKQQQKQNIKTEKQIDKQKQNGYY